MQLVPSSTEASNVSFTYRSTTFCLSNGTKYEQMFETNVWNKCLKLFETQNVHCNARSCSLAGLTRTLWSDPAGTVASFCGHSARSLELNRGCEMCKVFESTEWWRMCWCVCVCVVQSTAEWRFFMVSSTCRALFWCSLCAATKPVKVAPSFSVPVRCILSRKMSNAKPAQARLAKFCTWFLQMLAKFGKRHLKKNGTTTWHLQTL